MATVTHGDQAGRAEVHRLTTVNELLSSLIRAKTPADIYQAAIASLLAATEAKVAAVLLFDREGAIRFEASADLSSELRDFFAGYALWSSGAENARPVVIRDVLVDESLTQYRDIFKRENVRSVGFIPLETEQGVLGEFILNYPEPHTWGEEELAVARLIAGHVALAVELRRAQDALASDVVRRRKLEHANLHVAAIVESSDDAIVSKDLNGIVTSWNKGAERIFGYTAEEMVGKPIATIAAPDVRNEMPTILDKIRRGERVDHYETRRRTKSGEIINVSLSVSPIRDASGRIIGASKIARDITERKRIEKELKRSNEELRRANQDLEIFAYSASHDLQEPLRTIVMSSQFLGTRYKKQLTPEAAQMLDTVISASQRMESLIRDVLTYATASRHEEQSAGPVDANHVLKFVLQDLRTLIEDSGAIVEADSLPVVSVHENRLSQLFQNLIGNALKYRGKEPPRVHISAAEHEGWWVFSVADNGIGIDPAFADHIFGLFKRLHRHDEYPGSGIGLAVCQRIIEQYGGRIWLENSTPGQGSTFCFTVPKS